MSSFLREKDIEAMLVALENGDISEYEEDIGDENDIDYYPNVHELLRELDSEHDEENLTEDPPLLEEEGISNRVQSPEQQQDFCLVSRCQVLLVLRSGEQEVGSLFGKKRT